RTALCCVEFTIGNAKDRSRSTPGISAMTRKAQWCQRSPFGDGGGRSAGTSNRKRTVDPWADRSSRPVMLVSHSERVLVSDRKSTRLNSSHVKSSYAVFCLKKEIKSR